MSLDGAYDDANVFAKIMRGEIPAVKIFEDDDVLAFMDAFPQSKGHGLVISKTSRARNILEIEESALTKVVLATQRLARASRAALKPDGVRISQFNGQAAGQTVFHLHMHVIPMWGDTPLGEHRGGIADSAGLEELARQIRAAL
jgi:histidine triad (HIT) family protein